MISPWLLIYHDVNSIHYTHLLHGAGICANICPKNHQCTEMLPAMLHGSAALAPLLSEELRSRRSLENLSKGGVVWGRAGGCAGPKEGQPSPKEL